MLGLYDSWVTLAVRRICVRVTTIVVARLSTLLRQRVRSIAVYRLICKRSGITVESAWLVLKYLADFLHVGILNIY